MTEENFPFVVHSQMSFLDEEEDFDCSSISEQNVQTRSSSMSKERVLTLTISKIGDNSKSKIETEPRRSMEITNETISDFPPQNQITIFSSNSPQKAEPTFSPTHKFKTRKISHKPKQKSFVQEEKFCQIDDLLNPEEISKIIEESSTNVVRKRTNKNKKEQAPKCESTTQTESVYLSPKTKTRSSIINDSPMRLSELDTPKKENEQRNRENTRKQRQRTVETPRANKGMQQTIIEEPKTTKTSLKKDKNEKENTKIEEEQKKQSIKNIISSPKLSRGIQKSLKESKNENKETQRTPKESKTNDLKEKQVTEKTEITPRIMYRSKKQKKQQNEEDKQAHHAAFVIENHEIAEEVPQAKNVSFTVVDSQQINIEPEIIIEEEEEEEIQEFKPKPILVMSPSKSNEVPYNEEKDPIVVTAPQEKLKKFNPQATSKSSPKQNEFNNAKRFEPGYLESIVDKDELESGNNEEEEFLSPKKLSSIDEENDSLSEFLLTEKKMKNDKSGTFEFIPLEQEKKQKKKKETLVIPNYSKTLKIIRALAPAGSLFREISIEMTKYNHEHFVVLLSQDFSLGGVYLLDFENKKLKRIWGTAKAFISQDEIESYFVYDSSSKEFINCSDAQMTKEIEAVIIYEQK